MNRSLGNIRVVPLHSLSALERSDEIDKSLAKVPRLLRSQATHQLLGDRWRALQLGQKLIKQIVDGFLSPS